MKFFIATYLLIFINFTYADQIEKIECFNSTPKNFELEIEVDKFESLPPKSEVKIFYYHRLKNTQVATKENIIIGNPAEQAYKFHFSNNQVFDYLKVNLESKNAILIYNKPKFGLILISFDKCELSYGH